MSSTNTSSNLWGNTNNLDISNSGARLIMSHPISGFSGGIMSHALYGETAGDGVTAGDVVRYDTVPDSVSYNQYTKAIANASEYAEVVGVIETIENGVVKVVLSGQIKFPTARFATADYQPSGRVGGASGGNDVYFLSGVTAGGISNLAPNVAGQIAKPVLQVADDGVFNAHVVNYIGYQIGGNVAGTTEPSAPEGGIIEIVDFDGKLEVDGGEGWWDISKEKWLPYSTDSSLYRDRTYVSFCDTKLGGGVQGAEWDVVVSSTPSTTMIGKNIFQRKNNKTWLTVQVVGVDKTTNTITIRSTQTSNAGIIQEPDVTENFYDNNTPYTPTTITKMAFRLPMVSSTGTVVLTDMYGKTTTKNKQILMFTQGDARAAAVTIADEISVAKITATGLITGTDENGNTITDLVKQVKLLSDDSRTQSNKLNITSTVPAV